mgnify:CR=1 FL=1
MKEFKDISYLIDNPDKILTIDKKGVVVWGGKILKCVPTDSYQKYLRVVVNNNGKVYRFFIHRLLAIAFIPNPDNHPYVGHKDDCHLNNNLDNLYWVSARDNQLNLNTTKGKTKKVFWKELYPEIRRLLKLGYTYPEVVENLNIENSASKIEYVRQLDKGYRGSLWEKEC